LLHAVEGRILSAGWLLVWSRRLQMKRLVVALAVLTALAVGAEAKPPEAVHLVDRIHAYHFTHAVRDPESGKKHGGGGEKSTTEARQTTPAPRPSPQPARAD
jgi:hypothetical protein